MTEEIQELMQKPQSFWNEYAFSREPLKHRIPKEEQERLAELAVQCGKEEARKTAAAFPGRSPGEICREMGIRITYDEAENGGQPLIVAFFREPDDIHLSLDALTRLKCRDKSFQVPLFEKWEPEEILTAHELFHYIELKAGDLPVSTERVKLKCGPFSYRGKVQILSEIAGMAYAQELLGLSYCPFLLDKIFLYVYNDTRGKTHPTMIQEDELQ